MKINKLIIITIMLFALLLCIDIASAATLLSDDFTNYNNWDNLHVGGGAYYVNGVAYGWAGSGYHIAGNGEIMFSWSGVTDYAGMMHTSTMSNGFINLKWERFEHRDLGGKPDLNITTNDASNWAVKLRYTNSVTHIGDVYFYVNGVEAGHSTGKYLNKSLSIEINPTSGNVDVYCNNTSVLSLTNTGATNSNGDKLLLKGYDQINNGGPSIFYFDGFSYKDTSDFIVDINTTYKGYVTDANGNALQYCNVTLWNGNAYDTALKYDLTDANGYYEFDPQTVTIGNLYNISIKPPNTGYTNLYGFAANATTPLTLNFTSAPVRLQVYVYDANYGITHGLTGVNITVDKNTGATVTNWYNKSSPWNDPNDYYVGDYVNITAEKSGYVTQSYLIDAMEGGWNVVNIGLSQDFGGGSFVYLLGYVRTGGDGYKVPGVKAWLLDEANNVIDTSTSGIGNSAGYYALKVPTTPDLVYHVVVYAPGFGNKTAHLHNGGATTSFGTGSTFTYPDDYAGTIDGNAQVDLILDDLTWVPSTYPTPTPSTSAPVVPNGYNTVYGSTYVITTGQNIASVPVWIYGQDGVTLIGSGTGDASGNYVITFNTAGLASQILKVVPGETAKYNNDSSTTYISWPFAAGSTSYRCDVGLEPNADYAQWIMQGYFYNALKGDNYHISGGTLNLWTGDGNTLISTVGTNGNGYYIMYLEQTITPGTYLIEAKATGYTHANMTMSIPQSFGSDEYYNLSMAMVPASIGTDNNNALGIQITDNSTGNILNNAHYVIRYAANGTTYTTGSMGGQYVVYLYNLPPATYEIEGSFVGYDTTSYVIEIAANNWYKIIIGLTPVLAPTPYPTGTIGPGTPTPVTNPNGGLQWDGILAYMLNSFGIYDPVLVRLLKGVLIMFGLALGGGFAGAILERGKGTAVTLLFAVIGAGLGFIIACLVPGIWPWWLLVVVLIVAIFGFVLWKYISGGLNTGGNGGA